jgi:hypothetical protein
MDGEDSIRDALSVDSFVLNEGDDDTGILDQVDVFVNLSRKNETVDTVTLWIPFTDPDDDTSVTHDRYAIWASIAEGIGNLKALCEIIIVRDMDEDDG